MEALPLALLVALFDIDDPLAARTTLLENSPLGAREVYAFVNKFLEQSDPCNQADFRHLVTVNIPQGTQEIFKRIDFVVALIGKLVKYKLDPGTVHQYISVVVET